MDDDSSASYIHMVQHLIEKCLIFKMRKEECIEALLKHANIQPLITSTVWNELEKENKEFFDAYAESQCKKDEEEGSASAAAAAAAAETCTQMIQRVISQSDPNPDPDPSKHD